MLRALDVRLAEAGASRGSKVLGTQSQKQRESPHLRE